MVYEFYRQPSYDDNKFVYAGTEPPPETSDPSDPTQICPAVPQGWGGTGGSFHTADTIEDTGAEYGRYTAAAREAGISKRDAEQRLFRS